MKMAIVAVGRFGSGHGEERSLFERYARRLPFPLELREVEEKKRLPPDKLKAREAELLLGAVPDGSLIIALDEKGKSLTTRGFAERYEQWRHMGRDVAFVIGGADGLHDRVRKKADLLLCLGTMTWPHLMVRALVAEQVYRAHCILTGHPYHRD
ncbi:23S rRNA (pseudouridine(1915)-N(3))-methyltransferase RlmH [Magnetospira sp. QH-2]|uniref:23S rRNA (pseudouridine(1915)-N(3))-methyltransferase RlmH n=1 Tax=Magnetospira sp. (strain QH-2) TaxID=1288970 RepID=UPI0003E80E06|nr:23S rRNA (pseudouridine(1915)-N(3))-methyltransferase RlmH [Magnetospira sp. QH-2]CCQ75153.1 Ribosomal RNA large subunit methyltransferase H [Magnetospira sp. QH-2]